MTSDNSIELSRKVLSVSPSLTLAITAKAKEMKSRGIDIVLLSAGEPDFDTPSYVKQAAVEALQATREAESAGLEALANIVQAL